MKLLPINLCGDNFWGQYYFCSLKQLSSRRRKKKNMLWHLRHFLLPSITKEENFIISLTLTFKSYNVCFVVDYLLLYLVSIIFPLNSYILPKSGCRQLISINKLITHYLKMKMPVLILSVTLKFIQR